MIAKYNDIYCNVDLSKSPINIWIYQSVNGFSEGITRRGTKYYEKFVELDELDEVFDVGFSAKWNGKWCGVSPLNNNKVQLICGNRDFAIEHEMEEFERGVFWCSADIGECTEFRMMKENFLTKEKETIFLTKDEFARWYQLLRKDLTPQRT